MLRSGSHPKFNDVDGTAKSRMISPPFDGASAKQAANQHAELEDDYIDLDSELDDEEVRTKLHTLAMMLRELRMPNVSGSRQRPPLGEELSDSDVEALAMFFSAMANHQQRNPRDMSKRAFSKLAVGYGFGKR